MGEYAEMMLDGTCCQCCGEYLADGDGYPVSCSGCAEPEDRGVTASRAKHKPGKPKKLKDKPELLDVSKWRVSKAGNIVVGDYAVCIIPPISNYRNQIADIIMSAVAKQNEVELSK